MSKHNDIYNILGKLAALEPAPAKTPSVLKELTESAAPANLLSLKDRLTQQLAETTVGESRLDELNPQTVNKVYQARQQQAATAQAPMDALWQQRNQEAQAAAKAANPNITQRELGHLRAPIQPQDQATIDAHNAAQTKLSNNISRGVNLGYRSYDKNGDPTGMQNQNRYKTPVAETGEDKNQLAMDLYSLAMNIHQSDRVYNHEDPQAIARLKQLQAQWDQQYPGEDAFTLGSTLNRAQPAKAQPQANPGFMGKVKNLFKEDEMDEDMLSPKQKKIAGLRPPADKIDGKDLAALRAGKQKDVNEGETQGATKYTVAYKDNNKPGKSHSTQVKATSAAEAKAAFQEWDTTNRFTYLGSRPNVDTVREGEYQDGPNKSDIPAAQRKAKAAPGDDSWKTTTQDLDDEATKSPTGSAGLAKAKARLGMNEDLQADDGEYYKNADDFFSKFEADHFDEEVESDDGMEVHGYIDGKCVMAWRYKSEKKIGGYGNYDDSALAMDEMAKTIDEDDGDAYAKLPDIRKTHADEHTEYERAAQTIRKWMRKRGWDTKTEMKTALKYVMDNLDSKHDDTLTDEVKEACQCCMKHRGAVAEAGLDMNLLKGAQGGMKGVNTDPESERNSGKKYGYRNDRDDTGNDDDYDEHGNEKKKVAKKSSDGPKTKGRPKKNFGPERTTAKAYKHKGERVSENVNLGTFVEDTMAELDAIIVNEKDMGKHNNKTTGFKALAKKAGGGEKGEKIAGAQFQKMKKAGQLEEGVREHPIYTDKAAWDHYKKELDEEQASELMTNPDLTVTPSSGPVPSQDHELSELAKLAGLGSSRVSEASCNKTEGGVMCPVHGMSECWSGGMMEAAEEKADKDYDDDGEVESGKDEYLGSKIAAAKKAGNIKESSTCKTCDCDPCECDDEEDTKKVDENLSLLRMLAGIKEAKKAKPDFLDMDKDGNKKEPMKNALKKVDEWANEPNENYAKVDTIIKQGGDLNKSKKQDPKTANKAANPLKEHVKAVEQRLAKIYDSIKVK